MLILDSHTIPKYITVIILGFFCVCFFRITEHLGSGQFGTVNKGIWQSPAGAVEVAVKTLQSSASQEDRVKFLQEAAINGQFRHPNVVKLLGVVTVGEPVSKNNPLFLFVHGSTLHTFPTCRRNYLYCT